jgi:hypothetical protein
VSDRKLKVGGVRYGSSHVEETAIIRTVETVTAMNNGSVAGLKVTYEKYFERSIGSAGFSRHYAPPTDAALDAKHRERRL